MIARHVHDWLFGPRGRCRAQPRDAAPDVTGQDHDIGVGGPWRWLAALEVQIAEDVQSHVASMIDRRTRRRPSGYRGYAVVAARRVNGWRR
jgi:hypothetical protein